MARIGIITIIDNKNFGNRLQNFAMQHFLQDCGYQAETIRFTSKTLKKELISAIKMKLLSLDVVVVLRNLLKKDKYVKNRYDENINKNKTSQFQRFNEKYISFCKYWIRDNKVSRKLLDRFDYFVVGSDQIWNPNYEWFDKYITYLRFAPKEKRIAVAPSFGVSEIPEKQKQIISRYLKEMKFISVREDSGQRIVKELTGSSCDIFMDPTLLIDNSVWNSVLKQANKKLPNKYLLTYFLGYISEERKQYIENYASEHKLEIVNINSKKDGNVYSWGPDMFLKSIYECDILFTDSFHGCVFSILFHKQFAVFQRDDTQGNMFGRIDTLLRSFDLESQKVTELTSEVNRISVEHYNEIDRIIMKKRIDVKNTLCMVLNSRSGDKNED